MVMLALEPVYASSSLAPLKQENSFAVITGRDGDVLDDIILDGKRIGFDDVCSIRKNNRKLCAKYLNSLILQNQALTHRIHVK